MASVIAVGRFRVGGTLDLCRIANGSQPLSCPFSESDSLVLRRHRDDHVTHKRRVLASNHTERNTGGAISMSSCVRFCC